MNVLSVCSGIGCIDLGLERAGCQIVGQIEIDPFCTKVLEKHWPGVWRYGDLRELLKPAYGARELIQRNCGPIDLLCGGIPCQPASVAGKRRGQSDPRWLWPEFMRLVWETEPLFVLAENPSGVLSLRIDNLWFGEWISFQFQTLGYEVMPILLSAASVGHPHERERVWFMAYNPSLAQRKPDDQACPFPWEGARENTGGRGDGAGQLAYTNGTRQQQPQGGIKEKRGWLEYCGLPQYSSGSTLDDPDRVGRQWTGPQEREQGLRFEDSNRSDRTAIGVELGNADRARLPQRESLREDAREEFKATIGAGRAQRFVSRPGQEQYEWEAPRITTKSDLGIAIDGPSDDMVAMARWRRFALQAIGNGAIPQIAEILGRTLIRFLEERQNQTQKEENQA